MGQNIQTSVGILAELGHRLEIISHDARERSFLFQRLSLTVQRFNAVALEAALLTNVTPIVQHLLIILVFSPRDLYYRGKKNNIEI